jgi:hypothetical protein
MGDGEYCDRIRFQPGIADYLDPKMKASDSQVLDGTPAQLSIANEKISITSQRLPLCLAVRDFRTVAANEPAVCKHHCGA